MKKKLLLSAVLLVIAMLGLSGCGIEEELKVSKTGKVTGGAYVYFTEQEMQDMTDGEGASAAAEAEGYQGTEKINGVTYYKYYQEIGKEDLEGVTATASKFEYIVDSGDPTVDISHDMDSSELLSELYDFCTLTVTMPKQILATNGTLSKDKKTVTWDLIQLKDGDKLYAYTSKKDTIQISGVTNKGYLNKAKTVKIVTADKVKSITVNGKKQTSKKISLKKQGKYTVKVTTTRTSRTFTFTYDSKKPTTNVKAKTYNGKVKITFKDKTSGVKRATLDGKKIKNNTTVKKQGSHKLVITDQAGNKKTVRFTIK